MSNGNNSTVPHFSPSQRRTDSFSHSTSFSSHNMLQSNRYRLTHPSHVMVHPIPSHGKIAPVKPYHKSTPPASVNRSYARPLSKVHTTRNPFTFVHQHMARAFSAIKRTRSKPTLHTRSNTSTGNGATSPK